MKKAILIYDGDWHSLAEVDHPPGETRSQVVKREAEAMIANYPDPEDFEICEPTGEYTPAVEIEIRIKATGTLDCRIIYPQQVGE